MPTKTTTPSYLATARAFYGPAFDHKNEKALAHSMAEWAEMDDDEQSFTLAHLAFLGLQAQAVNQRLLTQLRDLLDEVAENLTVALEASLPDEHDEEEDEAPAPEEAPADQGEPASVVPAAAGEPEEAGDGDEDGDENEEEGDEDDEGREA